VKLATFVLIIFVTFVLRSGALAKQEHQHDHGDHEQLGQVNFRVSCTPAAQKQFNRAVAWLHSFEYDQAERAFAEVATADPACGMAYWGIAMSFYHQLWAPPSPEELKNGSAAVEKARSVGAKTKRELDYIAAIEAFYKDWDKIDYPRRASAYERAMEQVYLRYPTDREAGVFYALALNSTALAAVPMDKGYAKQKKAAEILNNVLAKEPEHPGVAHYLIHSYDYPPLAHLALAAARSYAKIAPSSAHAQHMPSHIFTRLGLWQEDIEANLNSEASAKDYAQKNHLIGAWDEQLHAMDYLAYAYLQQSRDREARAVLDELKAIRKTDPENFKCAYSFAAIPARWALERHKWSEATDLRIEPEDFPWSRFLWAEAITHFARGMGAARTGEAGKAQLEIAKLTEIQRILSGAKDNYAWATQVEIQRRGVSAWLALFEGRNQEALKLMRSSADLEDSTDKHPVTPGALLPARELLGDLMMELGRSAEALKEYEASLRTSPNRFNGLYGAGRAAEFSGDRVKAKLFYQKLVALCPAAASDRSELQHARTFLSGK
jgi:tetratricopeptide (TPR) repeat protein